MGKGTKSLSKAWKFNKNIKFYTIKMIFGTLLAKN